MRNTSRALAAALGVGSVAVLVVVVQCARPRLAPTDAPDPLPQPPAAESHFQGVDYGPDEQDVYESKRHGWWNYDDSDEVSGVRMKLQALLCGVGETAPLKSIVGVVPDTVRWREWVRWSGVDLQTLERREDGTLVLRYRYMGKDLVELAFSDEYRAR